MSELGNQIVQGDRIVTTTSTMNGLRRLNDFNEEISLNSLPGYVETMKEDILKRHEERRDVLIILDEDQGSITLRQGIYGAEDRADDPNDARNLKSVVSNILIGTTEVHEEFGQFQNLVNSRLTSGEMGLRLRAMRRHFDPSEEGQKRYEEIVTILRNFTTKINNVFEQKRDEVRGHEHDVVKREVENAPQLGAINLRFRILKGMGYVNTDFFMAYFPGNRGIECQLQNFNLDFLLEQVRTKTVQKAGESIKASLPGVPVIKL